MTKKRPDSDTDYWAQMSIYAFRDITSELAYLKYMPASVAQSTLYSIKLYMQELEAEIKERNEP